MMLAGATDRGCCFLEFHDRGGVPRIRERIAKRYRKELIEGNSHLLDQLESEVGEYFAGKLKVFTVTLDLKGTPFETAVWEQLLAIPYGETRSYGQIAALVGNPLASRAVGRANGENRMGIVVPCHRVIEANGNLRGYGGGVWRKRYLLDLEAGKTPLIQRS
jgi:AraC family transcriptional regulator of adaptative response/methylated-DNA-[protein]-cysteine methyltransferase